MKELNISIWNVINTYTIWSAKHIFSIEIQGLERTHFSWRKKREINNDSSLIATEFGKRNRMSKGCLKGTTLK